MRSLRCGMVVDDEDVSPNGNGLGLKTMEATSDDDMVSRRVTRSMKVKSNSSNTEVANEAKEADEGSETDTVEGVDKLKRKRNGKKTQIAGAVVDISEEAEGRFSAPVKSQSLGVARRIDKGKKVELGAATMHGSNATADTTVSLSEDAESDDGYDGGMAKAMATALDGHERDSKGKEAGIHGRIGMRNEFRIHTEVMEAEANGGNSKTRRVYGRKVRKKGEVDSIHFSDTTAFNSEKETNLINADDGDSDVAEEGHHALAIGEKRRRKGHRRPSSGIVEPQEGSHVSLEAGGSRNTGRGEESRKRALDIARSRAAHFAHFNSQDEDNRVRAAAMPFSVEQAEHVRRASELLAQAQAAGSGHESLNGDREDWPGPWTVARRLVERRFAAAAARQDAVSLGTNRTCLVDWSPSRTAQFWRNRVPPSLHQKCLEVLCRNINHVESLDGVPDSDKKWLVTGLCAQRKLTPAALRVCISASPTEILIPDCTCLTEEDLTSILSSCSVKRVQVLELTMCGRGMTDHCLAAICAEKGNSFPELQTLALRGAYRLVDQGLSRILNAAPKLVAMDLTLCSLISEMSVEAITDTVGTTVESLVLDSCTQLNGLKLLPSLRKLSNLRRLSLSGVPGVTDGVISELLVQLRFNLQELELKSCQALTDAGIQAVSLCHDLRILDLGHLPCLTDVAVGLIGDNCRNLRTLRLCRGKFSDTALAAYVSASGSCLIELSLNSTRLVGDHTIMALAQSSRGSLESLDVSWCRSISDQALGLLADSCRKLHSLKLFGCTQVTNLFLDGHSNEILNVTGIWESPSVTGKTH